MKLLEEILDSLPAGPAVEEAYVCSFDVAVRSAQWGLSSAFRDPCGGSQPAWVQAAGTLVGRPAREVAAYALSDRLLEASLGMAAVNSLLDPEQFVLHEINAAQLVAEKGRGNEWPSWGRSRSSNGSALRPRASAWRTGPRGRGARGSRRRAASSPKPRSSPSPGAPSSTTPPGSSWPCARTPTRWSWARPPPSPPFSSGTGSTRSAPPSSPTRQALPCILQGAPFRMIEGMRLVTAFRNEGTVR